MSIRKRNGTFFIPQGSTELMDGDKVFVLSDAKTLPQVRALLEKKTNYGKATA